MPARGKAPNRALHRTAAHRVFGAPSAWGAAGELFRSAVEYFVRVQLLAHMGGAPPGSAELGCCCLFPLLPLVAVLAMRAMHRNAAWPAVLALVLVGLPCLVLWGSAVSPPTTDDPEVLDETEATRRVAVLYSCFVAVAGFSLCLVIGARLLGPPQEPSRSARDCRPAHPTETCNFRRRTALMAHRLEKKRTPGVGLIGSSARAVAAPGTVDSRSHTTGQ